jgi:acyl carrier protein
MHGSDLVSAPEPTPPLLRMERIVTTETSDIFDDIVSIVGAHGQLQMDSATLRANDNLFHAGMTSHASVSVMLALESHFDIEFPERMLQRSTFESVSSIRAAVGELLTES